MECITTYAGDSMFEVSCPNSKQFVVDLANKTCGCRQWEMTGIPCPHAFSAILYDCGDPADYVDKFYSLETYKKTYAPMIYPMPSEEQWIHTNQEKLEPPRTRVPPGRPKKLRRRGPDESRDPKNPNRMRKFGAKMRCSKCRVMGHKKRSCPQGRTEASEVRDSAPQPDLPTPPLTSVSLINNYKCFCLFDIYLVDFV